MMAAAAVLFVAALPADAAYVHIYGVCPRSDVCVCPEERDLGIPGIPIMLGCDSLVMAQVNVADAGTDAAN